MIPLRLHIKNFLSYGPHVQTINFEPYHLICLSGKNGHGKSALLDAITWALWGQARKVVQGGRSEAHLLRLGSTHMVVSLDFRCNNYLYRVRREYSNEGGKNATYLDFGMYDEQAGQWRTLTTKFIRETQDLIISAIGLDAEAFENSAFLRQGHSDEFSSKSPKDRKEMLANILGIGMYEILRKKSIERAREENIRYQNSMRTCEILKQAIAPQAQVAEELVMVEQRYADITVMDQHLRERRDVIRTTLKDLYHEKQVVDQSLTLVKHIEQQIQESADILKGLWTQWRDVRQRHKLLAKKHTTHNRRREVMEELSSVQQAMQKKIDLIEELARLKASLQEHTMNRCKRHEQELQIALEQEQRYTQQDTLTAYDEQRTRTSHQELLAMIHSIESEQQELGECDDILTLEALLARSESQCIYFQTKHQRASLLQGRVLRDLDRAQQEKAKLLTMNAVACSLCLQEIQTEYVQHISLVRDQYIKRYVGQNNRLERVVRYYQECLAREQGNVKIMRVRYKNALQHKSRNEASIARKLHVQQQIKTSEAHMVLIESTRKDLYEKLLLCRNDIAIIRRRHEQEQHADVVAEGLANKIQVCELAVSAFATIQERYQVLQQELREIAEEEQLRVMIMQEVSVQSERKDQIKQQCERIRVLKGERRKCFFARESYDRLQKDITTLEKEDVSAHEKQLVVTKEKELLARQKGALDQSICYINQQKISLEQEKKNARICEDNAMDYTLLGQVLSKDGIQGMLIEHVLPEIEYEANVLLAKLTDNQAQLQFESLRGLKSGVLKETLDIKIADSLGTRSYELFSGGEAFRIDFALRLAISKLLARRAGASVQTLIIDEGFGSQDEEGLHYIMESLYTIQHEFAKIIIVSHLSSMKNQFPTHFHIYKGLQGSVVHLVEQG